MESHQEVQTMEERENSIRENQATIQAIEEQLNQKGPTLIPSGSQGVDQPNSPVASHHLGTRRSVATSHHSSQSQVVSRRRQGYKGKNKISFSQKQRESDPMSDKLLKLVKEVQKSQKWVKIPSRGHAQLSKASEGTNKRLNQVFEEQNHFRRDRDCLEQDLNKLFNVYQIMKPQPQGHVLDSPYHQEDIQPDDLLENKERLPSQYQDADNMSYSEKEELKKLPEASSLPKFSGMGEYDHM
ncbi:hypothetical protein O181_076653 [Austropuccinia psidii MF-1]|uniref:Uncharacterized protein n=1 Tax=Austropuccinia psidii MF-1 TaxID=1389203 RepID=A0A9Q3FFF3_9BASI|nr:hypothetical protein [Austropuccinia psidii MF-1]